MESESKREKERYTPGPNHQLYTININSYYTSSIVIIHYYTNITLANKYSCTVIKLNMYVNNYAFYLISGIQYVISMCDMYNQLVSSMYILWYVW